jgi:hypothetical protein
MIVYRDRKEIDMGGGTGVRVTFKDNSTTYFCKFHFVHCNFTNFKGTALHYSIRPNPSECGVEIPIAVSFDIIAVDELNKYTEEMCLRLVLEHISVEGMFQCLGDIIKISERMGGDNIKTKLRSLIGCVGRED